MPRFSEILERIRRLIDGEDAQIENALINIQITPSQSKSERFRDLIVRATDSILRDEIIRFPSGKVYIPARFTIFISEVEDKGLRDDKKAFLEKEIGNLMLERAKELGGQLQLLVSSIEIRIKVDGTLTQDEVRAVATTDLLRETLRAAAISELPKLERDFFEANTLDQFDNNLSGTIDEIPRVVHVIEVWKNGEKLSEYPFLTEAVTIGREMSTGAAVIKLPSGNRKISRLHATLRLGDDERIWVTSMHNNPTLVDGQPIVKGETVELGIDGIIDIYGNKIKIRLKE